MLFLYMTDTSTDCDIEHCDRLVVIFLIKVFYQCSNNDNVTITFFFCYVKIVYNVTHNVGYVI